MNNQYHEKNRVYISKLAHMPARPHRFAFSSAPGASHRLLPVLSRSCKYEDLAANKMNLDFGTPPPMWNAASTQHLLNPNSRISHTLNLSQGGADFDVQFSQEPGYHFIHAVVFACRLFRLQQARQWGFFK